jgi:hypothetical protein
MAADRDADVLQHLVVDVPEQVLSISLASKASAYCATPIVSSHFRISLMP